ncbi:MAG TPA: hypothetical protein VGO03_08225 [Acidimicrobiia bacterium]|jgi:hypothetical protein
MRRLPLAIASTVLAGACASGAHHAARTTKPAPVVTATAGIATSSTEPHTPRHPGVCGSSAPPPAHYAHVVVIMEENRRWPDVGGPGFNAMPYLHSLTRSCAYYTQWNETNAAQSSLTQYIGITSGVDNPATVNDCSPSVSCRSTDDNIFRQVRASHGAARAFVEGATSGCSAAGNAVKHVPALYYFGNDDRSFCDMEVRPLTELDVDHLPTFAMITPNLCDDGHDCGNSNVDSWLSVHLAAILRGADYRAGTTAVFVCYDEDRPVPNLVVAPTARPGPISSMVASHSAALHTWEEMLGVPVLPSVQQVASLRDSAHV